MLNRKSFTKLWLAGLSFACLTAFAGEKLTTVVAPQCLLNKINAPYEKLAYANQVALVQTNALGIKQFVKNKMTAGPVCGGFIDVSAAWKNASKNNFSANNFLKKYAFSSPQKQVKKTMYAIQYPQQVAQMYGLLNPQNMWSTLTDLSSFHDRYMDSDSGEQAAQWVKKHIEDMAASYHRNDVTVLFVTTKDHQQPSILVKVGNDFSLPGIVLGSHMDSVEATSFDPMPAADDDGSGTVTLMETLRTVFASNMTFKKPLYFIWYAGEEEGLVGSQNVVEYFQENKIAVESVFNFDMTGYTYNGDRTLYLIRDNTDQDLSAFLEKLEKEYVKQPVQYTSCGYACSDHATWTAQGYKSAFPFEGKVDSEWHIDPYIHSTNDRMEVMSLAHMTDFAKLALAFVVEAAGPVVG